MCTLDARTIFHVGKVCGVVLGGEDRKCLDVSFCHVKKDLCHKKIAKNRKKD